MKTISATEAKNRFGEHFAFGDGASLVIETHGTPTHRVFTAKMGRRLVLAGFSAGVLSANEAMALLGIDWYGDLLEGLAGERIDRPDAHMADSDQKALAQAQPLLDAILE